MDTQVHGITVLKSLDDMECSSRYVSNAKFPGIMRIAWNDYAQHYVRTVCHE